MVGINYGTNYLSDPSQDSKILMCSAAGSWGQEDRTNGWQPMNEVSFAYGPERSFARSLAKDGQEVAIIKFAMNGSALIRDFHEEGTEKMLYAPMIDFITQAINQLEEDGQSHELKGVIWLQGSGDSNAEQYADAYGETLLDFVNDIRRDLAEEDLVFITAHHPALWTRKTFGEVVARQQIQAASSDENIWIIASHGTNHRGDEVHYTPRAMELMGVRFAEAMKLGGRSFDSFRLINYGSTHQSIENDSDLNGKSDLVDYVLRGRSFDQTYYSPSSADVGSLTLIDAPIDVEVEARFYKNGAWCEYREGQRSSQGVFWNLSDMPDAHSRLLWQLRFIYDSIE